MSNLINYSPDDISRNLAYQAHHGTSFSPGKRADEEIKAYLAEMTAIENEFAGYVTEENKEEIKADLEHYRTGYIQKLTAYLQARSRCISVMITGASNFPTRRNEKANATADKRSQEFIEWRKKTLDRLHRTYNPIKVANAPISSDDSDAIGKLQAKITKAETVQATMVAANKIVRKKGLTDDQKVAELVKLEGITETSARELLKPDFAGRVGFPSYAMTNNNANIKRMRQRVSELEKARGRDEVGDIEVNGVTISENRAINRLQLFFPGKPSQAVRDQLKSHGFRWSPKEGAWQRQLNPVARQVAMKIIDGLGNDSN